jgi:hypothetical protein
VVCASCGSSIEIQTRRLHLHAPDMDAKADASTARKVLNFYDLRRTVSAGTPQIGGHVFGTLMLPVSAD